MLAFGVGSGPQPTSTLSAHTGVGVVTVVLRWLFLSALLMTGGLALFDLFVSRLVPREWFAAGGAVVAVAASILVYRSGAGLLTRFGLALSAGAAGAALTAVAAAVTQVPRRLAVLAALVLLPVPTFAGHSLDAGRSWIDASVDFLHVLAVAFWLGSLVALAFAAPCAYSCVGISGDRRPARRRCCGRRAHRSSAGAYGRLAAPLREGGPGIAQLPAPDAAVLAQRDGNLAAALAVPRLGPGDGDVRWEPTTSPSTSERSPSTDVRRRAAASAATSGRQRAARSSRLRTAARRSASTAARRVPRRSSSRASRTPTSMRASVVYDQRIATTLAPPVQTRWVEVAPDAFSYDIEGGAQAVVIEHPALGPPARLDLAAADDSYYGWPDSALDLWPDRERVRPSAGAAHDRRVVPRRQSIVPRPVGVVVDRRTLRVVRLQMTAAAHFMHVRYVSWNRSVSIRPPTG
ncbi:MAG TPA: hypothetical protein VFM96_05820 [Gaiellaceae bacterium]|nr:hypothetical protein [Gaiellaceae bacterium]